MADIITYAGYGTSTFTSLGSSRITLNPGPTYVSTYGEHMLVGAGNGYMVSENRISFTEGTLEYTSGYHYGQDTNGWLMPGIGEYYKLSAVDKNGNPVTMSGYNLLGAQFAYGEDKCYTISAENSTYANRGVSYTTSNGTPYNAYYIFTQKADAKFTFRNSGTHAASYSYQIYTYGTNFVSSYNTAKSSWTSVTDRRWSHYAPSYNSESTAYESTFRVFLDINEQGESSTFSMSSSSEIIESTESKYYYTASSSSWTTTYTSTSTERIENVESNEYITFSSVTSRTSTSYFSEGTSSSSNLTFSSYTSVTSSLYFPFASSTVIGTRTTSTSTLEKKTETGTKYSSYFYSWYTSQQSSMYSTIQTDGYLPELTGYTESSDSTFYQESNSEASFLMSVYLTAVTNNTTSAGTASMIREYVYSYTGSITTNGSAYDDAYVYMGQTTKSIFGPINTNDPRIESHTAGNRIRDFFSTREGYYYTSTGVSYTAGYLSVVYTGDMTVTQITYSLSSGNLVPILDTDITDTYISSSETYTRTASSIALTSPDMTLSIESFSETGTTYDRYNWTRIPYLNIDPVSTGIQNNVYVFNRADNSYISSFSTASIYGYTNENRAYLISQEDESFPMYAGYSFSKQVSTYDLSKESYDMSDNVTLLFKFDNESCADGFITSTEYVKVRDTAYADYVLSYTDRKVKFYYLSITDSNSALYSKTATYRISHTYKVNDSNKYELVTYRGTSFSGTIDSDNPVLYAVDTVVESTNTTTTYIADPNRTHSYTTSQSTSSTATNTFPWGYYTADNATTGNVSGFSFTNSASKSQDFRSTYTYSTATTWGAEDYTVWETTTSTYTYPVVTKTTTVDDHYTTDGREGWYKFGWWAYTTTWWVSSTVETRTTVESSAVSTVQSYTTAETHTEQATSYTGISWYPDGLRYHMTVTQSATSKYPNGNNNWATSTYSFNAIMPLAFQTITATTNLEARSSTTRLENGSTIGVESNTVYNVITSQKQFSYTDSKGTHYDTVVTLTSHSSFNSYVAGRTASRTFSNFHLIGGLVPYVQAWSQLSDFSTVRSQQAINDYVTESSSFTNSSSLYSSTIQQTYSETYTAGSESFLMKTEILTSSIYQDIDYDYGTYREDTFVLIGTNYYNPSDHFTVTISTREEGRHWWETYTSSVDTEDDISTTSSTARSEFYTGRQGIVTTYTTDVCRATTGDTWEFVSSARISNLYMTNQYGTTSVNGTAMTYGTNSYTTAFGTKYETQLANTGDYAVTGSTVTTEVTTYTSSRSSSIAQTSYEITTRFKSWSGSTFTGEYVVKDTWRQYISTLASESDYRITGYEFTSTTGTVGYTEIFGETSMLNYGTTASYTGTETSGGILSREYFVKVSQKYVSSWRPIETFSSTTDAKPVKTMTTSLGYSTVTYDEGGETIQALVTLEDLYTMYTTVDVFNPNKVTYQPQYITEMSSNSVSYTSDLTSMKVHYESTYVGSWNGTLTTFTIGKDL